MARKTPTSMFLSIGQIFKMVSAVRATALQIQKLVDEE